MVLPGTLWNLSSHDSVKMEIVDHALHALSDEVMVPHSGWEQGSNGAAGGEENLKPRHLEWEVSLTNTAGCLRYEANKKRGGRKEAADLSCKWWIYTEEKQSGALPEHRLTEQYEGGGKSQQVNWAVEPDVCNSVSDVIMDGIQRFSVFSQSKLGCSGRKGNIFQ